MMIRRAKILALAPVLFLIAAACNQLPADTYDYQDGQAELAGRTIFLEVAADSGKQAEGLSGQPEIPDNRGMLFVYEQPARPYFWMKGMLFDIDIVWISGETVIGIQKNVKAQPGVPESELRLYSPKSDIDRVLELRAGWADRYGLDDGDKIKLK